MKVTNSGSFGFKKYKFVKSTLREREFIMRIHVPWNGNSSKDQQLSLFHGPINVFLSRSVLSENRSVVIGFAMSACTPKAGSYKPSLFMHPFSFDFTLTCFIPLIFISLNSWKWFNLICWSSFFNSRSQNRSLIIQLIGCLSVRCPRLVQSALMGWLKHCGAQHSQSWFSAGAGRKKQFP